MVLNPGVFKFENSSLIYIKVDAIKYVKQLNISPL